MLDRGKIANDKEQFEEWALFVVKSIILIFAAVAVSFFVTHQLDLSQTHTNSVDIFRSQVNQEILLVRIDSLESRVDSLQERMDKLNKND